MFEVVTALNLFPKVVENQKHPRIFLDKGITSMLSKNEIWNYETSKVVRII